MLAATQMSCSSNPEENIIKAEQLVRTASAKGAQIILLQELFETLYFCQKENPIYFRYASALEDSKAVNHFKALARELKVVLPISFYERKNNAKYIRWRSSTLTEKSWGFTGKPTFPTDLAMRKNFILIPEIRALKFGKQDTEGLA